MDTDAKDVNGGKTKAVGGIDSAKVENRLVNGEEDSESNSLLPPRRGGMSRKSEKTQRKVQWNDRNGNKLTEVMVFDPRKAEADVAKVGIEIGILVIFPLCCTLDCPTQYLKRRGHTCNLLSDASDSDDEDSESCICTIM